MRYEITLNGKVYEVEVDDNRALIGAIRAARPAAARPVVARPVVAQNPSQYAQPSAASIAAATANRASAPLALNTQNAPQATNAAHTTKPSTTGEPISAPMPGLIKDIRVQKGQQVTKGQVLMILEAMKMENEIVSPRDGAIAEIIAAKGQTVKPGAILLTLT